LELPNTVEGCHVVIHQLLLIIEHQQKQIDELKSRVAELEARLAQNSRNSSRPPSSDGLKRKAGIPKEPKEKGGQRDHQGKNLGKVDTPDHTVRLVTPRCSCGLILDPQSGVVIKTHQVFDLPQPKLEVTEYQVIQQVCSCGCIHQGQVPQGINAGVQYGPGVRALSVLLNNSCQLSFQKISILFEDLFGYKLNESTAVSNNKLAYQSLESSENQIKASLVDSPLVHFDETGILVSTKLKWLHTACNTLFTYLFVSTKRGGKAHQEAASILAAFRGWAVHDCYATYFTYTNCRHALCVAHLLRELQAQIEQQKLWATELKVFLLDLYKRSDKGREAVPQIAIEKQNWLEKCQKAIQMEELLLPKPELPDPHKKKKRGRKPRGKGICRI
jgi:transposase